VPDPESGAWIHAEVEVRPSPIAGRGLFTAVDLPAGTVVLAIGGTRVTTAVVADLGVGFPNHSCDPNVGWVDEQRLATTTEVSAGEELVTDYAMCIVEPDWFLRCHCPSYRCRQMVEGTDWRIPQLQQRYAGWWAPHVPQHG
jgi:hypothetical protein